MKGLSEFSGADHILPMNSVEEMQHVVQRLMSCGHSHNFCVAMDGLRLYTTEYGVACISGYYE